MNEILFKLINSSPSLNLRTWPLILQQQLHGIFRSEGCPEHLAKRQHSRSRDNALFCNYINPCLVNPLLPTWPNRQLAKNPTWPNFSLLYFYSRGCLGFCLFIWPFWRLVNFWPSVALAICRFGLVTHTRYVLARSLLFMFSLLRSPFICFFMFSLNTF
jgi:hypothetical protein